MSKFTAKVLVWPYSTGEGSDRDQAAVGSETQDIQMTAENIHKALEIADIFVAGIKTNPRVWEVKIISLAKEPHT